MKGASDLGPLLSASSRPDPGHTVQGTGDGPDIGGGEMMCTALVPARNLRAFGKAPRRHAGQTTDQTEGSRVLDGSYDRQERSAE